MQDNHDAISTGLGEFSKKRFNALLNVRSVALAAFRDSLVSSGYTEVSTSSLVNIAGSCENPHASFKLNYYGKEAHLSQSAQLQLEALVIRLRRGVFTVNNSFREENYEDPEANGRRLSEFTLIEAEMPYEGLMTWDALKQIMVTEEEAIKTVIQKTLNDCEKDIEFLGGHIGYLKLILDRSFNYISYDRASALLNQNGYYHRIGDDIGIREERKILALFDHVPTFVSYYPAKIKFFNMKRTMDGERAYSVDLLMPRLGETAGGAVREEDGEKIKQYLLESKIAKYIQEHGGDTLKSFGEYLNIFEQEEPVVRGGFGVGFERFIGFLLNSNDILETIAYRSMQPSKF